MSDTSNQERHQAIVHPRLSLDLIPWPRCVRSGARTLQPVNPATAPRAWVLTHEPRMLWSGVVTPRLEHATSRFLKQLDLSAAPGVGSRTDPGQGRNQNSPLPSFEVHCHASSPDIPGLVEDESYTLQIATDPSVMRLEANTEWGILRGFATLKQLLQEPVDSKVGYALPEVEIIDQPASNWRGLMLDVARHFISAPALHTTLEAMACYKFNVLHLHLTDDQGFRFPSEHFPQLSQVGGAEGCYTRRQLRELIEHAGLLGIRVVPELDVPGHCSSWLAAHPEWGAWPDASIDLTLPATEFGPQPACLNPADETVYTALGELFDEVADVFPDSCIHIGGDEVAPHWWRQHAGVQQLMQDQGFENLADVQNYFNLRVVRQIEASGRTAVAWDEVMHPKLPERVIVQSWRCARSRDLALERGFPVVFSSGYYLDLFYPADLHYGFLPGSSGKDLRAQERALVDDPRLAAIRPLNEWLLEVQNDRQPSWQSSTESQAEVLGGEACLWSELVTEALLDRRLWSRAPAIAESLWWGCNGDIESLYQRMQNSWRALQLWAGVTVPLRLGAQPRTREKSARRDLERLGCAQVTSLEQIQALHCVLSLLEPIKGYSRLLGDRLPARIGSELHAESDTGSPQANASAVQLRTTRPYDVHTPLNRVVDLISPESLVARHFSRDVEVLLSSLEESTYADSRVEVSQAEDNQEGDNQRKEKAVHPELLASLLHHARSWQAQLPHMLRLAEVSTQIAEILPLAEALSQWGADVEFLLSRLSSSADEPAAAARLSQMNQRYRQPPGVSAELYLAVWLPMGRLLSGLERV